MSYLSSGYRGYTPTIRSYNSRYGSASYGSSSIGSYIDRYGGSSSYEYRSRYSGGGSSRPTFDYGDYKPKYDSWQDRIENIDVDDEDDAQPGGPAPPLPVEVDDDIMADLHADANKKAHHSNQYGVSGLVIRRGQTFKFTITLGKGHTLENSKIVLQFATGKEPKVSKRTRIRLNLQDTDVSTNEWGAKIDKKYNNASGAHCIDLSIMAACDAVIGQYTLWVDVLPKGEGERKRYKITETLYIIFNAWCKDDQVCMTNDKYREEYVMNETGRIYVGQKSSIHGRPWNYGQFAKACLEASFHLLETSYLQKEAHGNPVLVSRAMSAMANSNDDDGGILTGNWSGEYIGGTAPTSWNGSVAILEEFMRRKRPVKYGQCWVFSGLLTTLMRAIGIPSRSVTNFESAHDHDCSMTIDSHMTYNGRPKRELDDSVWNFHVWNESWFERPDLPKDGKGKSYGGWQAFDATPQEQSEGKMRCGPAPLKAIKEGCVYLGYDTKFIFAEVNGDRVTWLVDGAGDMMATKVDLESVGKFISTKRVGANLREDITELYKHKEGSAEERATVERAGSYSSRKKDLNAVYGLDQNKDVTFEFSGHTEANGDVVYKLHVKNTSTESRSMKTRMTTAAKYYTGIPGEELNSKVTDLTLESGKDKNITWKATASEYINHVAEDANICVYILAKVLETGQIFTAQETFSVDKPDLDVQASKSKAEVGEEFDVVISFTNPLSVNLTGGAIRIEGPGIQKDKEILLREFIKPGQKYSETVNLTPKYTGHREIIASFHSRQLTGITGSTELDII